MHVQVTCGSHIVGSKICLYGITELNLWVPIAPQDIKIFIDITVVWSLLLDTAARGRHLTMDADVTSPVRQISFQCVRTCLTLIYIQLSA